MKNLKRIQITPLLTILLFGLLTIGLFLGGLFYFKKEKADIKANQYSFLSAISSFKVNEITKWTYERSAEGRYISTSPNFLSLLKKINKDHLNSTLQREMELWVLPLKKNLEYRAIWVCNANGELFFSLYDDLKPFQSISDESRAKYMLVDKIGLTDLQTDKDFNRLFLDLVVPVGTNIRIAPSCSS